MSNTFLINLHKYEKKIYTLKILLYNNAMNKLQEYIKNRGRENVAEDM